MCTITESSLIEVESSQIHLRILFSGNFRVGVIFAFFSS